MLLAYPFLDVLWSMLVFFVWIAWFLLLFHVIGDVFRRRDASGAKKTLWLIFVLFVPFLGNADVPYCMMPMDEYVRATAGSGGAAGEIEKAKGLLDSGAITQAEFDAIKAKALAA